MTDLAGRNETHVLLLVGDPPEHDHPDYTVQFELHPSPLAVLLSSHCN